MAKLLYGDRIGGTAPLTVDTAAATLDPAGQMMLLTRRADNGQWCLPGGRLELGQNAAEGCAREALDRAASRMEETGLTVRFARLIGVHFESHMHVALTFEAEVAAGQPVLSDETTAWGWFAPADSDTIGLMDHHRQRMPDVFAHQLAPSSAEALPAALRKSAL